MHLDDVIKNTKADFIAGNAVAWIGPPGGGKTFSVGSLCRWAVRTFPTEKIGFSTVFMATQSPIGLGGLPWKGILNYNGRDYTITEPALPQWYLAKDLKTGEYAPADQFDRVILVLEEWGQGDAETKRAGAELLKEGACGRYALPAGSFRMALSNNDVRDGITKEFDFIINRRSQYMVTGQAKGWVENFADHPQQENRRSWLVMPIIKHWALKNEAILFEAKPTTQGPWCTPRSLTMADRYAQVRAEMNGGKIPMDDFDFVEGMAGKIGMPAAQSLINHMRFRLDLPSYEDVVKNPSGCDVPIKPDLMMLMSYELAGSAETQHLPQVIEYVTRFKSRDMHVTFITSLLRRDYANLIEDPAVQDWVGKNGYLVSVIGSLAHA